MTAKIDWYREILELDPASKAFFKLALLLAREGQEKDAIPILEQGLSHHPDFLEARIMLIDLLHKNAMNDKRDNELAKLSHVFSAYPGFWRAWAEYLAENPAFGDTGVLIKIMAACLDRPAISLQEVLTRGIESIFGASPAVNREAAPPVQSIAPPPIPPTGNIEKFNNESDAMLADLDDVLDSAHQPPVPPNAPAPESAGLASPGEEAAAGLLADQASSDLDQIDMPEAATQPEAEPPIEQASSTQTARMDEDTALAEPHADEMEASLPPPEPAAAYVPVAEDMKTEPSANEGLDSLEDAPETNAEKAAGFADAPKAEMTETALPGDDGVPEAAAVEELPSRVENDSQTEFESSIMNLAQEHLPGNEVGDPQAPLVPGHEFAMESSLPGEPALSEDIIDLDEAALPAPSHEDDMLPSIEEDDIALSASSQPESPASQQAARPPFSENMIQAESAKAEAALLDAMELPRMDTSQPQEELSRTQQPDAAQDDPILDEYTEEEQFSLRTRSMAEVLAEQGDLQGALDIYQELAASATSADELNDINQRIATLQSRLEMASVSPGFKGADSEAQARSKEKLIGMLEALAQRVEARAQN